jgi:Protein of unknown function (DUF1416)
MAMRSALLVLSFTSALAVGACASAPTDRPADPVSGVRGHVLVGPQCPVAVQGSPCPDRPWRGTVRLIDAGGDAVAEVTTDTAGRFEVPVAPGAYTVTVLRGPAGIGGVPQRSVTVPDGGWVEVVLTVDTGIR